MPGQMNPNHMGWGGFNYHITYSTITANTNITSGTVSGSGINPAKFGHPGTMDLVRDRLRRPLVPEQFPHFLIIENLEEDLGQDDYQEELDWEIEHHPDCPHWLRNDVLPHEREEISDALVPVYSHYTCPVGHNTTEVGLDVLSDEEGKELDWRSLEPGRYPIEAWVVRYPSTPNSPEEYDSGLRLK